MRHLFLLRLASLLVVLGIIAFTYAIEKNEAATESAKAQSIGLDFGLSLYKTLLKETNEENLFYSPYNILSCLSMPYMGAKGDTHKLMHEILQFPEDQRTTAEDFYKTNLELTVNPQPEEPLMVSIANSVWMQKNEHILPDFQDAINRFYQGSLHEVDFRLDSASAREQINDWVSNKTHYKIMDLLKQGDLTTDTRFVLVSTLYFKAAWLNPFDIRYSHTAPFTSKNGKVNEFPFMLQTKIVPYLRTPNYSLAELEYASDGSDRHQPHFSMVILLPHEEEGLFALEGQLNAIELEQQFSKLRPAKLDIHFPKFKLTETLFLRKALSDMGLSNIFTSAANFEGITGKSDLEVSNVLHQAYINVDEAGTEAAAATAAIIQKTTSVIEKKVIEFKVNRPFLFFIRDKATGATIFIGKVVTPIAK